MTDVPAQVLYGEVTGHFVRYIADTADAGNVPDEMLATGKITITPLTPVVQFPTTTPPRLAVIDAQICIVKDGNLYPPDQNSPGVYLVASHQPDGNPQLIQWRAHFAFDNVATQPGDVVFEVPAGGVFDLSQAIPIEPTPPVTIIQGPKGEPGKDSTVPGPPGPANALAIGTVTTGAPGSSASATITGTPPSQTLSMAIPRGDTGAIGNAGVIVLSAAAPVPGGTQPGTIILRTAT